ncbi:helix-turn-helix domain-containing protein [Desulforamulus putei]|uniref:Protein RodZ, contains Xre-like HTH and DUF4115 domains n=1 Tax=Desulforamulus putei DSM 12395 TaxID=1121429 RepID=A0A1M4TDM0_9FIRM|nr:helix-turn-helix domain-containing protein [Desulforamulus putei]SHE42475.1 protein RodZ, contains Xre-like HTH and DUF4115 domains [Desulforamulus putei DSM 12395]
MPIGEVLRNARIKKGYSFEYLEEATKIRAKYLEALENENFDVLPGQVYARAFLRTYAKFLDLDSEQIMNELSQMNNEAPSPKIETEHHDPGPSATGSKKWRYAAAGLAIIALLAFNALYHIGDKPEDNKPELPNTVQQPPANNANNNAAPNNPPNNTPPEATQPPRQVEGVRVVLKVTDSQSWMQIVADGKTVFSGMVNPGETKDFQADEKIYLHVGNAGAVEVNVNGKDLGRLGEPGKVRRQTFNAGEEPQLTRG